MRRLNAEHKGHDRAHRRAQLRAGRRRRAGPWATCTSARGSPPGRRRAAGDRASGRSSSAWSCTGRCTPSGASIPRAKRGPRPPMWRRQERYVERARVMAHAMPALHRTAGRGRPHAVGGVAGARRRVGRRSAARARGRVLQRGRGRHALPATSTWRIWRCWCWRAPPPGGAVAWWARSPGGGARPAAARRRVAGLGPRRSAPAPARRRRARAHSPRPARRRRHPGAVPRSCSASPPGPTRGRAARRSRPAAQHAGAAERDMLLGVFSLADTTVAEVMTPRIDIVAVDSSADREEVTDILRSSEHARLLVYDGAPRRRGRRDLRQGHPRRGPRRRRRRRGRR